MWGLSDCGAKSFGFSVWALELKSFEFKGLSCAGLGVSVSQCTGSGFEGS